MAKTVLTFPTFLSPASIGYTCCARHQKKAMKPTMKAANPNDTPIETYSIVPKSSGLKTKIIKLMGRMLEKVKETSIAGPQASGL